jgi:serine phosphatase RsbU (regulator of sigma subunit)
MNEKNTDSFLDRVSFRGKLLGALLLLALTLTLGVSIGLERAATRGAMERFEAELSQTRTLLQDHLERELQHLELSVESSLADPLYRSQVSLSRTAATDTGLGAPTAAPLAEVHRVFASADLPLFKTYPLLAFFNDEGKLLYSKANPTAVGLELPARSAFLSKTLKEGRALEVRSAEDSEWLQAGILPKPRIDSEAPNLILGLSHSIRSGVQPVGAVIVAVPLESVLSGSLSERLRATLLLTSPSAPPFGNALFLKALGENPGNAPFLEVQGETYLRSTLETPLGKLTLLRELENETALLLGPLRNWLWGSLIGGSLLAFAIAVFLSSRLTRPLRLLEESLRKLETGDLWVSLPVRGRDEIAFLTRAFNRLTESLREKTELESLMKRLKSELHAARDIQRSLLPPPVQELAGARIEALYHPCEELSGDFYDVLFKDEWTYLYLADVTSHGTASAQVTYVLKGLFRTALQELPGTPELQALLLRLGADYARLQLPYDVALQVARYHPPTRRLEFLRAHAPAGLLLSEEGASTLDVLPSEGLTQTAPRDFSVKAMELRPGDQVCFFTDGSYDFEFETGVFGRKRLVQLLQSLKHEGPSVWSARLLETLTDKNRSPLFKDDLTVLRLTARGLT